MAYDFNGTSQFLRRNVAPVTAVALTFSCWVAQTSAHHSLVGVGDKDTDDDYFDLFLQGDGAGNASATAYLQRAGTSARADSSTKISDGAWHHACAVFAATNSRSAYLDGGGKVTNTTLLTPNAAAIDHVIIGGQPKTPAAFFGSGPIAEVAIWDAALVDAEVAMIAAGLSPLRVRPGSLVFYLPMRSGEGFRDWVGGLDLGADNGGNDPSPVSDHPPVWYPRRAQIVIPTLPTIAAAASRRFSGIYSPVRMST